jgi:hypothetical protein
LEKARGLSDLSNKGATGAFAPWTPSGWIKLRIWDGIKENVPGIVSQNII